MGEESEHLGLMTTAGRSFRSALVFGCGLTLALPMIDAATASREERVQVVRASPVPRVAAEMRATPPQPQPYPYPVWTTPPRSHRFDRSIEPPTRQPDVKPRLIRSVPPRYTEVARRARVSGVVLLEVVVEADGSVSRGRILKPLPFGLNQSAIEAVRQYRFRPGTIDGRAVPTITDVAVTFRPPAAGDQ